MPRKPSSVLRAMRRTLAGLPDPDRTIFMRVRFDDDSYERIARDLGLTVAEVERGVSRALLSLHAAATRAKRRELPVRIARFCAWLRGHFPQGWRE